MTAKQTVFSPEIAGTWTTAIRKAAAGMGHQAQLGMVAAFVQAVAEAERVVAGQLKVLAEVLARENENTAAKTAMWQRVGVLAQRSTVDAYGQLVTAQEGPGSATHYRAGQNRLPRTLLRALGNPTLFEAWPGGLRWINTAMLSAEAAHWHRINFGAAPIGRGSSGAGFAAVWGGVSLFTLAFEEQPSWAFKMPRGLWVTAGYGSEHSYVRGSGQFYPTGKFLEVPTQGIKAKNFLDAGLARIAKEIPVQLGGFYEDLYTQFKVGTGSLMNTAHDVVRPVPIKATVTRFRV